MTGQELVKLSESSVFRQVTMDSIINEFVPDENAFLLTDAFLPHKNVDKETILDLINNGAFGRTNPVELGADHARIAIPGFSYKEHTPGHWREAVKFAEDVLVKAVNPARPNDRWGAGLAASALSFLDQRLNTQIEYLTAKVVVTGQYSEARFGVNYTYDPEIPAKYYQDITSSPAWTSAGTWNTAGSATPINDMIQAKIVSARYGHNMTEAYMSVNTMEKFYNATATQNMLKSSPALVGRSADRKYVFETLTGLTMISDNRLYAEETVFNAASAVGDTTLEVVSATEFTAADVVTLRNSSNQEEEATISSISGNILTISEGTGNAYVKGDRVTVYKQFLPDDKVILRAPSNSRMAPNNWLSTPSLIKGNSWTTPQPGRYTWTDFQKKVPYTLEIGAGIDGGPKIGKANWMVVTVAAA